MNSARHSQVWDLDSILPPPESPEFGKIVDDYRARLTRLAEETDRLGPIGADPAANAAWTRLLPEYEGVESLAGDLGSFIGCHSAADAGNRAFRQVEAKLSALDPLRERIATSLEFALQSAAPAQLEAWIASNPWLQANRFFIEQRCKNASLRLPKPEETLAADLAVDGLHAWGRLFDRLSGDLRITVMEKGQLVEKSPSQVRFDSPERSIRENNFFAADKAWKTIADSCADSLNHLAGTRLTLYRRLGLKDHLDVPLHRNRLRRETLETMWRVVSERRKCLLPYLSGKAKLLGLDRLCWYDTQAPLPQAQEGGESPRISYDDGLEGVIRAFRAFSPELGDFAQLCDDKRWIEAENRAGKRQGAFCTGLPTKRESRVFMTFTNSFDNVSTLAHELGHAYHSWVLREQPLFLQDYPMNLAETASTFAEAVLAEDRLQHSRSKGEKLGILDHMCSDAVAYLMNIHARFVFEDRFHQERREGEVSTARLSELMLAAQKETYLDALDPAGWYPDFWVSKLHFYISGLPFYNFPYTFGFLLSTGLFALAPELGASFPQRYRDLLIATGCQETEAAVKSTFGYDLAAPDFWNRSLDVVERRVSQFLELV